MAHCGYEATAVEDTLAHPLKALLAGIRGPRTTGDMVEEIKPQFINTAHKMHIGDIPVKIEP